MKADEIRALPEGEIAVRHDEVSEEFFNLRFQNGTGQLENYKRLGSVRKDLARIQTILRERALGIDVPIKAVEDRPKKRTKVEESKPEEVEIVEEQEEDSQ